MAVGETNDKIKELIEETEKEIKELTDKLAPFKKAKTKMVTQAELNKAEANLKKSQEEWKKRRNGCI